MPFQKGNKINLGRIPSKETRLKMGIAQKGHPGYMLGKKHSRESRVKMRKAQTGRKHSIATRKKISEAQKGEKGNNWKGGIWQNPYPPEFNETLKLKIRTRDNFTCCLCGKTEREELEDFNRTLCVNHIDFDKTNCNENNFNTLCLKCNTKIGREREYWTNYFKQNKDER